jgi:hypothetical protein
VAVEQDKTKKKEFEARAKNISKGLSTLPGMAFIEGIRKWPMDEESAIVVLSKGTGGTGANPLDGLIDKVISCDGDFWLMCTVNL